MGVEKITVPFVVTAFGLSNKDIEAQISTNVLGYVLEGSGTIEMTDVSMHLVAGDSYVLRADEAVKYSSDSSEPWTRIWVEVSGDIVTPVLDAYGLTESMCLSQITTHEYIKRIHKTMDMFSNEDLIMEQCCDSFVKLCQYIRQQMTIRDRENKMPRGKETEQGKDIFILKTYMDTHLSEHFTLEKCSQIVSLSVSQTIRKFRAAYGVAPCEYINQKRMEKAKQLLEDTSYSIQEIAEYVGFQDPYYFSKYFKKRCGKAPNIYRKEVRENKETTTD